MSHDLLLFTGLKRKQGFLFLLLKSVSASFLCLGGADSDLIHFVTVNCFAEMIDVFKKTLQVSSRLLKIT